jgi:hypothetical protein
MITAEELRSLPKEEKVKIMEILWEDLMNSEDPPVSPDWHAQALEETKTRYKRGEEIPLDWDEVKRKIRKETE